MSQRVAATAAPAPAPVAPLTLQRACACGQHTGGGECESCRKKQAQERLLQRAPTAALSEIAPPIVHDVLRSSGQPLDSATQALMGARFGHDFSRVRVHADPRAAESARAVNALAYTVGRDIVFDAGQYQPRSSEGQRLLAHELTHVVQQTHSMGGAPSQPDQLRIGAPDDALEQVAQRHAALIEQRDAPILSGAARGVLLQPQRRGAAVRRGGTTFVPGVAHNHAPTGRWAAVQADASTRCGVQLGQRSASQSLAIECSCALFQPSTVLSTARNTIMLGLPLAQQHLDHYRSGGGADFIENLGDVIRRDTGVVRLLQRAMRRRRRGHINIRQSDYAVRDFQFAFGAIDRLDFEIDRRAGTVHLWFMDRYEWHPVGFGYRRLSDDARRDTNCVHAAAVELKSAGAADYWMIGDVVLPLTSIMPAPAPTAPSGTSPGTGGSSTTAPDDPQGGAPGTTTAAADEPRGDADDAAAEV